MATLNKGDNDIIIIIIIIIIITLIIFPIISDLMNKSLVPEWLPKRSIPLRHMAPICWM